MRGTMKKTVLALVVSALIAAGCGSDQDTAAGSTTTTTASTTETAGTDDGVTTTGRSVVTTDEEPASTETTDPEATTSTPTTEAETTTTTAAPVDDLLRLAPPRDDAGFTFRWDRTSVSPLLHSGPAEPIDLSVYGQLSNVVSMPYGDILFQTTDNPRVIWRLVDGEAEGLLVAEGEDRLILEGTGLDEDGNAIVLYQYDEFGGTPETTRRSLRSFSPGDGTVVEIAPTGGWESGARFTPMDLLGPSNGDTAVASWGAEGWTWMEILDLQTGDTVFNSQTTEGDCFSGDTDCFFFEHAVVFDGDIVGMAPIWNEEQGWIDQYGLVRYDTESGGADLLMSWPWDNGTWYVEDMFLGGPGLVVSLQDAPFEGDPLPPLFVDLVSGESWTLPEATFLRPAHLS